MESPKRKLLPVAAACAALIALSSCASLQRSWDLNDVKDVVGLLNKGQSQKLAAMCATPFLVDGEIVVLKADIASFWDGVVKADFRVEGVALDDGAPVKAESYKQFADTMEVKSFFAVYVKKGARILSMTSSTGKRILLIMKSEWFSKQLIGFKGPF